MSLNLDQADICHATAAMVNRIWRPMSHVCDWIARFCYTTSLRDNVTVQLHAATLSCHVNKPNQHDWGWYSCYRSSVLVYAVLQNESVRSIEESKKRLDRTISQFWNCVREGGSWNGKSGAEAVFVYATKSQRASRQSQRLQQNRAIKSQVWHRSKAT